MKRQQVNKLLWYKRQKPEVDEAVSELRPQSTQR